jgi:hypothetical protein
VLATSIPRIGWKHTQPICENKGRLLRKVPVVKDKKEFRAIWAQALQGVRNSAGEVLRVVR